MVQTTRDFGGLAGTVDEPAADPNRPMELPRTCGTCMHFTRLPFAVDDEPRRQRFGNCGRWAEHAGDHFNELRAPTDLGPDVVGDEFGCNRFKARH